MFMGHLGIALGAEGARNDISLLVLALAATAPDLVDFALEGARRSQGAGLWTHSVASMFLYAAVLFVAYSLVTRHYRAALLVGAVGVSHVLVDLLTSHMQLWRGGPLLGLHLYLHRWADFTPESLVILAGWAWYRRTLDPARRTAPASFAISFTLLARQALMATVKIS